MKCVLRDRVFSANLPKEYIPKDGDVWEAVNEDTGAETLVIVKKDGPQDGGCIGCIADPDRWNAGTCTHITCGNYGFKLIDLGEVLEGL